MRSGLMAMDRIDVCETVTKTNCCIEECEIPHYVVLLSRSNGNRDVEVIHPRYSVRRRSGPFQGSCNHVLCGERLLRVSVHVVSLQIPMYLVRGSTCRTKTLRREGFSKTDSLHLGTSYTNYRSPPCGAPMWRSFIRAGSNHEKSTILDSAGVSQMSAKCQPKCKQNYNSQL
jgi:hypothetical protein